VQDQQVVVVRRGAVEGDGLVTAGPERRGQPRAEVRRGDLEADADQTLLKRVEAVDSPTAPKRSDWRSVAP
jgi:hypothetical protein